MSNQELATVEEIAAENVVDQPDASPPEVGSATAAAAVEKESVKDEAPEPSAQTTETPPIGDVSIHNLRVGQRLVGTVKNIANFGAFIDVGIPQDGLVHISKLAKHKVEKVSDVVSQGQEVEVWVKKVDKKRGRLSLTMVKPVLHKIKDIGEDAELEGVITRLESYGAFVDIDSERDGLIHISQITHDFIKHPEESLQVGDKVKVKVLSVNRKKRQVDLSIKALLPLPVKEIEEEKSKEERPQTQKQRANKPESGQSVKEGAVLQDEEPRLTAMAVAYAALQDKETDESPARDAISAQEKRQKKKDMDEIIARTLASREQ